MAIEAHRNPPTLFRVIIPVTDIEQAAAFYGAVLDMPGERVSTHRHYFACGETILACVNVAERRLDFRPNLEHFYFAVDDLEGAYKRAGQAGCEWLEEGIAERDWGERSFYARDPFGNPICFVDRATTFTGGRFVP